MSVFVAFFFLLLVLADSTPRAASSIPLIGKNLNRSTIFTHTQTHTHTHTHTHTPKKKKSSAFS